MSVSPATKLYTPRLLGLAAALYHHPLDETAAYQGAAQSRTCGSSIRVSFSADAQGRITRTGMAVTACAIGQASAAILAGAAQGRGLDDVASARSAIEQWLSGNGPLPDWPGFDALEQVLPHTGRHGALLIAWTAAHQALSSLPSSG